MTHFSYEGLAEPLVRRAAITLKLCDHWVNGSLVAAPTSSLPAPVGGVRNWDYRYTWIRDAAFTVFALRRIGFGTEADAFLGWVLDAFEQSRQPRIMYDLDGSPVPDEREDPSSKATGVPPRCDGATARPTSASTMSTARYSTARTSGPAAAGTLSRRCGRRWPSWPTWPGMPGGSQTRASGRVRSEGRVFTYSAAMCQVALDRAAAIGERLSLPGPVPAWRAAADKLRQTILDQSWSEDAQTLSEHLAGGGSLDASLLALPLRRVLPAGHPRMVATTAAIAERLSAGDGLLYRYLHHDSPDGIAGDEGAFLLCSFWLVENLALQGRLDEAGQLYASLCARASPLGLLPEQIDPSTGEFIGNFPQAFSHIGVIASGVTLARALAATDSQASAAGASA
jgi:GH15 family glucan-1,4-alpha-glucosidase